MLLVRAESGAETAAVQALREFRGGPPWDGARIVSICSGSTGREAFGIIPCRHGLAKRCELGQLAVLEKGGGDGGEGGSAAPAEMSGRELAERLVKICPRMKVLYMSGYTEDAILHHGVLDEGIKFISKPFTITELAEKVRLVLDE